MEDAIYGGRVDNAFDMRVLRAYLGLFFSAETTSDRGAGAEVLPGTPLKIPQTMDLAAVKRAVGTLPDTDGPFMFCLPDNIERSLQRNTSSLVVKQLRALSLQDIEAAKFDREKWRAQLGPVLDQWQAAVSASPGLIARGKAGGGRDGDRGGSSEPLADFVLLEVDLSAELCLLVDTALAALKKVRRWVRRDC